LHVLQHKSQDGKSSGISRLTTTVAW